MNEQGVFSVYKSSAGSGKTYSLVKEYIMLALYSPAYFRHILAITFTNKAANEMKQRILSGLEHLSDVEKYSNSAVIKFMLPQLSEQTGIKPEEISRRAGLVLTRILHRYDDFAVRTIDSFVAVIIRTFARDLHLPVDFEIELDKDVLLNQAIEQLIAEVGANEALTSLLVDFTLDKLEDEKNWNVENDIKSVSDSIFTEDSQPFIHALSEISPQQIRKIAADIKKTRTAFETSLRQKAAKATALINSMGIENASFYRGSTGIGTFFRKLADGVVLLPNSYVQSTISDNKWTSAKVEAAQNQAINTIIPQLTQIYSDCISMLESGFRTYNLLGLIRNNIFQMGVIAAVEQQISAIRRDQHLIHISEFNKRITNIILNEPVPFIYERVGEKYHNYLVDEFQDTSELQWKNLLPLIGDSLANGRFNLLVGDGKQAIYRFRNGNVGQFLSLPELPKTFEKDVFANIGESLALCYQPKILDSNFRSLPEIIHFNNSFFDFAQNALSEPLGKIYSDAAQKVAGNKTGGFVSVEFIEYDDKDAFVQENALRVTAIIRKLIEKGYAYSDIAILTRTNREGSKMASFLMSEGISVLSAEALLLTASPAVNLIINLLSGINFPDNQVFKAAILRQLMEEMDSAKSLSEFYLSEGALHQNLEDLLAQLGVVFNSNSLKVMALYDLVEELIRLFDLNKKGYDVYLQFFLEFVNKIASKQGNHIADLLDAWEEKKRKLSVSVPEGIDAVRIMTIHKSKGLEFPVVIWPMATEKPSPAHDQMWLNLHPGLIADLPVALVPITKTLAETDYIADYQYEKDQSVLDMINLVYVAFTRAMERLYVLTREPSKSQSENLQNILSQFLHSKPEGWTETDGIYTRGDDNTMQSGKSVPTPEPGVKTMVSSDWSQRIRITGEVQSIKVKHEHKQAWGTLVHSCLASLNSLADLEKVITFQTEKSQLSEEDSLLLTQKLKSTLEHPQLERYFSNGLVAKNEAAILTPSGNMYRPDRVVFLEDETCIIEFKTGLPDQEHEKQLLNYAGLLAGMGYSGITKLLVYLDNETIVKKL